MKSYVQWMGSTALVLLVIWLAADRVLAADFASVPVAPALQTYLGLPLSFEANRGQAPSPYGFVAHGPGYALAVAPSEVALTLHSPGSKPAEPTSFQAQQLIKLLPAEGGRTSEVHLRLTGGNPEAAITGLDALPGRSNYFIGNDPSRWRTQVPQYRRVRMEGVYPGTDLVFYGNPQQLEYDFRLQPGADPSRIRFAVSGAQSVSVDAAGNAVVQTSAGELRLKSPVSYQEIAGNRKPVSSRFRLLPSGELGFEVGYRDRAQALVIDPVLSYSLIVDGNFGADVFSVAVDNTGSVYVTGDTCATDFPTTAGPLQTSHGSLNNGCEDVYVVKLDPTASTLVYSDLIGGSLSDVGGSMAVDANGNVYLTGITASSDFPSTPGAQHSTFAGGFCDFQGYFIPCLNAFAAKLDSSGRLAYSALLGTDHMNLGLGIVVDGQGNAYVVGATGSANFPVQGTNGQSPLQATYGGGLCYNNVDPCTDAFITKLNSSGAIIYSTYLGGSDDDAAFAIAVDSSGDAYVTGVSDSTDLKATPGVLQATKKTGTDAFVAKIDPNGAQLLYLTFAGGSENDSALAIALDGDNAIVGGITVSSDFWHTTGVFQPTYQALPGNIQCSLLVATNVLPNMCGNGFVLKLNSTASALVFSTFVGGTGPDSLIGLTVDSSTNIWVTGETSSQNFPVSQPGTYYTLSNSVSSAAYLLGMSSDASQIVFATLLNDASAGTAQGFAVTTDGVGDVFVGGSINDTAETTPGVYAFDTASTPAGFVQKWNTTTNAQPQVQLSATALAFLDEPIGVASPAQAVTLTNIGTGPMQVGISISTALAGFASETADFIQSNDCPASLAASAFCTINVLFQPKPPGPFVSTGRAANLLIRTNAPGAPHVVTLGGNTGQGPTISFTPNPVVFPTQPAGEASPLLPVDPANGGDMNLNISNIAVTGLNASEFTVILTNPPFPHPCTQPVFATGSCEFQVQFTPAANATGTRSATLVFTDNAADSPQSVSVSGVAASGAILNVSPTALTLDPISIGAPFPPSAQVTLTNPSATDVTVNGFVKGGTNAADFGVSSGNCNASNPPPFTLTHGTSCTILVSFSPTQPPSGLRQGTLTLTTNPALTLPTVTFSGAALSDTDPSIADLFLIPNPMDFGTVALGQSTNPGSHLFQFTNPQRFSCAVGTSGCGGPLSVSAITTGAPQYTLLQGLGVTGCNPPMVLQPGSGCTYELIFTPTAPGGAENGMISIVSNAPQGTVTFPLTGSGLAITKVQALPGTLQFGSSAIGVKSAPLPVVLQNIGNASFSVTSAVASGAFSAQLGNCNQAVLPGQSCTVTVTFTPNAAGNFSGVLTVTDNAWGGQQVIALSGAGASGPGLLLSPPQMDFGTVKVGSTSSPAKTIQLLATGDAPVTVTGLQTNGDFLLAGENCPAALTPGESCTAQLKFKPSLPFQESGSLLVTSNAPGSPQVAVLTGTGVQPGSIASTTTLGLSPNPVDQGQAVTLAATVTGGQVFAPSGTVTFVNNGVPLSSVLLDSTGAASFVTSFGGGTHPLSAIYSGDSNFAASNSAIVNLAVNASLSFSPPSLSFGIQLLATPSPTGVVTLTNASGSALAIGSIAIAGANSSDFGVVNQNCPISPSTLATGNSCMLQATFTPQAAGPRKSSISISDNLGVQTIVLTGVGTAISTAPTSLSFGSQQVGTPSAALPVVITNKGSTSVSLYQIAFVGANAGDFSQSNTGTCGSSLGAGANCTVNVIFTPAAVGSRTASLVISDNGGGSPQPVPLTGTGTSAPAAALSSSTVAFGEQAVGTSSRAQRVVLSNRGSVPLAIGFASGSEEAGGDFVQTNTCGPSLAAGASCAIEIRFAPRAPGNRTGVINVLFNGKPGGLQVKVQGTGIGRVTRPILSTD